LFKVRHAVINILCQSSIVTVESSYGTSIPPAQDSNRRPQKTEEQHPDKARGMQSHFQNSTKHEQSRQNCQTPADLPHMQNHITAPSDTFDGVAQFLNGR
jgi:hypothetical protein